MSNPRFFVSENKEQKTSLPLFPTPSAKNVDYPFVKTNDHFVEEKQIDIDGAPHHFASVTQKKGNLKQNWYVIYNFNIPAHNVNRRNSLIVAAGEIYSLAFGGPKYRIKLASESSEMHPYISKGIKGFMDFVDYMNERNPIMCIESRKGKFSAENFIEGMGRVILNKYLYKEDDLTFANLGIDEDGMFVAIDPGQTFAPLPNQLEEKEYKKYTSYYPPLLGHQDVLAESVGDQGWYYQKKLQHTYTGIHPHVLDYDDLPNISYFLPRNWEFNDQLPYYSKQLAEHQPFLNEKHFAALKELVTKTIKSELIEIHVCHEQDQRELQKLINATLADFLKEIEQSAAFLEYLKNYRLAAVKAIFYEIREFITKNSHYQYRGDLVADQSQWNNICQVVLDEFVQVLESLKQKKLSADEINELKVFAAGVHRNEEKNLQWIKSFYKEQGADIRAKRVMPLILKAKKSIEYKKIPTEKVQKIQNSPEVFFFTTASQRTEHKESREEATRLTKLALEKEEQFKKDFKV